MSEPDYTLVSHDLRIELLMAIQRQKAELAAREQAVLHALALSPGFGCFDVPAMHDKRWVREEVACAMRISPAVAGDRLDVATHLITRLPSTFTALRDGKLSMSHVSRLCDATVELSDKARGEVEKAVLPRGGVQTVPQFTASVRRAVARFDTRDTETKHTDEVSKRRVVFTPQDHGVTELWALLPAEQAAAIRDAVHQHAKQSKGLDGRTPDQRRADAFTDLIVGTDTVKATVHVTVALSTLLAMDEQGAELQGHGTIPAALARALAFDPNATWRKILTTNDGHYLEAGADTYKPGAALDRHVRLRDRTCRFPGCRRDALHTEIDHRTAWADGGPTVPDNLQALCSRHHHLKHETMWTVTTHEDGSTRWRDPTGHHYQQPPPDPLPVDTTMSRPAEDPPPFWRTVGPVSG